MCAVNQTADKPYYLFDGYAHLAAGLSCGLAGLAAGMAIGIVGDAGVRCGSHRCTSSSVKFRGHLSLQWLNSCAVEVPVFWRIWV